MVFLLILAGVSIVCGLLLALKEWKANAPLPTSINIIIFSFILFFIFLVNNYWNLEIDTKNTFTFLGVIALIALVPGYFMGLASLFTDKEEILDKATGAGCLSVLAVGVIILLFSLFPFRINFEPEPDCIIMPNGQSNCTDGPEGIENNNAPGLHDVKGHYRGGTYIEPYIRSNPDGDPTNNLNPE
jgi:hypothetical protein